jgi:hypothetical protein
MSVFQIPAKQSAAEPQSTNDPVNLPDTSTGKLDLDSANVPERENKTIVLDGPLSTIYTKALNIVYSNTPDSVSQESQAMDHVIMAQDEIEKNQDAAKKSDLYVYVTDSEHLEIEGTPKVFDKLRLALDKNKNNMVAIETSKHFTTSQAILEDFLHANHVKVYHSRDVALEKIKLAVNQL